MNTRRDLPGYSNTQETETLGLLAVQRYLVRNGFKVTEVSGRFDDGLDLFVSPHDGSNVLPAIAGIQVRSGPSHRGLPVGRHERYWRELNLPVFGVVLTDSRSEPANGNWCDAQAYLRDHTDVRVIPTPYRFPDGLAEALHAANDERRGIAAALDVFHADWEHQASAIAALVPLATDLRVIKMLDLRLPELGPRAAHYALHLLVIAEAEGIDTRVAVRRIARAVETLYESDIDGHLDLDAFHDGTAAAYRFLEICSADPLLVLDEALRLPSGEPTIMFIAMAVSLASDDAHMVLQEALHRAPNLRESPDFAALAQSVAEGGYSFSW